jgi:hypothetical protein
MFLYRIGFMLLVTLCAMQLKAQQFEIGKASDKENTITADSLILAKAISRSLGDGTVITTLRIESKNSGHYLIAEGTYKNFKKIAAFELTYNINNRTYYAQKGNKHFTCASAACDSCSIFKENGKIVGCKCAEKSTISNQCNFTRFEESMFYMNLVRAKQMLQNKNKSS